MKQKSLRRFNESCVATLILVGIHVAFAFGVLLRNTGSVRQFLLDTGLADEWALISFLAAGMLCASVILHSNSVRYYSLVVSLFANASTYAVLLFGAPALMFAPFGLVLIIAVSATLALIWLHIRGQVHLEKRKGHEWTSLKNG
jgi:hypothetical protein